MKYIGVLIILLLFAEIRGFCQKTNDWKLTKYEKGVKIYIRNGANSSARDVLGTMTTTTSLSALVYLVKDSENHYQWIYANKYAKLLKTISDFEWIYYNESEAPWPVSNRDLITHAKLTQDSETHQIIIDSQGVPDYIPAKEGLVRVKKLHSVWVFTPGKYGQVNIRFELEIDLGGNIPTWLVNTSIEKGPLHTLQNMAKVLQQEKYKTVKLPYIIESKN